MIKEVCVENFTHVPKVIRRGADRIELCDNLAVGGTTVSKGVLEKTIEFCRQEDVSVMAIIRPRGGDFVYTAIEKAIMLADIQTAIDTDVSGIVIGALTNERELDTAFLSAVKSITAEVGLSLTFHMAFDDIPKEKQKESIEWLSANGFDRILTHGGPLTQPIEQQLDTLKELIEMAGENITIMPGGGITKENLPLIERELDVQEAHGTKIV